MQIVKYIKNHIYILKLFAKIGDQSASFVKIFYGFSEDIGIEFWIRN